MKRILLSAVLVFAGAALWAQAITGDSVRDARIKAEIQNLTADATITIDEQTYLSLLDNEIELVTKYLPKNKLTENMVQPEFGQFEVITFLTPNCELRNLIAKVSDCEWDAVGKYAEDLKDAGWNFKPGMVLFGEHKSEPNVKLTLTYQKRIQQMTASIYNYDAMSGYTKTVIQANGDMEYYRSDRVNNINNY
ncbi:MAG: hypothetical protein IKZ99_09160 [Salinivirgaceae bacterium]|nr:hypothetical protein [Salinivirgaceae bacterium]